MDPSSDCEEKQSQFEDAVCRIFETDGTRYEILDRNMLSDPFEPDIVLMDEDEWVLSLICSYFDDFSDEGYLRLFPDTFSKRKWVVDSDDSPVYILIGVGGSPSCPEHIFFTRFFNINSINISKDRLLEYSVNCFNLAFLDHEIMKDFERIYSPS